MAFNKRFFLITIATLTILTRASLALAANPSSPISPALNIIDPGALTTAQQTALGVSACGPYDSNCYVDATGAYANLSASGNALLGTNPGTTNAFGTGTGATNTIGNATGTNQINGATTFGGAVTFTTTPSLALNSGTLLIGNASNLATAIALSGDATITTAGVLTIGTNAITLAKLATDAVNSSKILDNSVTTADITDTTITDADISATAAILYSKLSLGNSIVLGDLTSNSVNSSKIVDGSIVAADLASDSVTSAKILDGTVTNLDIANTAAIAYSKLTLANSITSTDIVDGTVTGTDLADGTVALADLASNSVDTSKIVDGTIANADIASGTIDLTAKVTGTLPVSNGGTGLTSATTGDILYASAANTFARLPAGTAGQVLTLSGGLPTWAAVPGGGGGTVTSVAASGGTTGLSFSGSPITTTGTLSLAGTLTIANGGTGATTAATARSSLGAAASGANADITDLTALTGITLPANTVASLTVTDDTILNVDIAAAANIALSKLASGSSIVTSLAAPSGSSSTGGTIASNILTLSLADASNPGLISTSSQTIAGAKTFSSSLTAASFSPTSATLPANGLFLPSVNTVGLSTNSTERLRIDSSGNVGIGTATPSNTLQVNGTTSATNYLGNVGTATVTKSGGTTARTLAAAAADTLSVKDFGAVGDGATDDTAAFSAALTAACAKTGRRVFVPASSGAYIVSSTLPLCSFLSVEGDNAATILYTGSDALFDAPNAQLVAIRNLTLQGISAADTYAVRVTGTAGIGLTKARIQGNNFINWGTAASGAAIRIDADSPGVTIADNQFNNQGTGVLTTAPTDTLNVSDNYFVSSGSRCVDLGSGGGEATVQIRHNNMTCAGGAVRTDTTTGHVLITDNEFEATAALTDSNSAVFNFVSGLISAENNYCNINAHGAYCFYVADGIIDSHFANNLAAGFTTKAVRVGSGYGNLYFNNRATSGGVASIYSDSTYPGILAFTNAGSTNTMGIGTSDPAAGFEISRAAPDLTLADAGQLTLSDSANRARKLAIGYDGTRDAAYLQAIKTGVDVEPLLLNPKGGNVGIGATSPTAQLHTTGSVRFATFGAGSLTTDASGNVTASSDERLKDIKAPFTRGLQALTNVAPITYRWNATSGLDQTHDYTGLSAQNIEANIPEAVSTDPRGFLTLSDRPIIATIINAIKEIASITGDFKTSLIAWLGAADNGLATVRADKTQTNQLCLGDTCLSQSDVKDLLQLKASLLSASGSSTSPAPTPATPTSAPANDNPAPSTDADTAPASDGSSSAPIVDQGDTQPTTDTPALNEPANDNTPAPTQDAVSQ